MRKISKCLYAIMSVSHLFNNFCCCCKYAFPHSFYSYFKDGLKTIAHFGTYIDDLSAKLTSIKQKQDEERRRLLELKTLLRSTPDFERVEVGPAIHSQSQSPLTLTTHFYRILPPTKAAPAIRCTSCRATKITASLAPDICSRRAKAKFGASGRSAAVASQPMAFWTSIMRTRQRHRRVSIC